MNFVTGPQRIECGGQSLPMSGVGSASGQDVATLNRMVRAGPAVTGRRDGHFSWMEQEQLAGPITRRSVVQIHLQLRGRAAMKKALHPLSVVTQGGDVRGRYATIYGELRRETP